jgi:hypothetical protein
MEIKKWVAAVLMVPSIASAEFFSGNDILSKLDSSETMQRIHAMGFVQGVYDVYTSVTFCPPAGVTAGQARDIARNFLYHNPAIRHKTAESLINEAFKQVWPCANNRSGRGA